VIARAIFSGCIKAPAEKTRSMKDFELYSRQVGNDWYFSLLAGTDRHKTQKEIMGTKIAVKGKEALKQKVRQTQQGESIFWFLSPQECLSCHYPSEGTVKEFKSIAINSR